MAHEEITLRGKAALMQLKEFAIERGLDIDQHEDRAQMYDGLRPDVQEDLKATAKDRGWALEDVVAAYVQVLVDHYKKIS